MTIDLQRIRDLREREVELAEQLAVLARDFESLADTTSSKLIANKANKGAARTFLAAWRVLETDQPEPAAWAGVTNR